MKLVLTLGALLADVPHTRPVSISGLGSDQELIDQLGLERTSYEGPTGIVGVLHDACQRASLPSASLWAAVPHYVAAAPNPKAALALVRRFEGLAGVAVDGSALEEASEDYERQVNAAVESDPEVKAFVERLEETMDEAEEISPSEEIPSADAIARDFQRFLRQRGPSPTEWRRCSVDLAGLFLRRRADDPVVAERADLGGRRGLELLRHDALGDLFTVPRTRSSSSSECSTGTFSLSST